jgi:hypothetical protein
LRAWAIDVIQKRGNFTFNQAQQEALLMEGLPFGGTQHNPRVIGGTRPATAAAVRLPGKIVHLEDKTRNFAEFYTRALNAQKGSLAAPILEAKK